MQISRVYIENYRSIKALDFSPHNYCVLIGENDAGKSNLLRAINLVLGEMWPTDRTFTIADFHRQNAEHDIVIQVYFDTMVETWKNMTAKVYGFELRCKAYKRAHKGLPKGTLSVDYTCINAKGETVKYPAELLQEGKQVRSWYDLKVSKELKEKIPFIYVDGLRDYYRQDPGNRWSVLRKMLDDINHKIANDKETVKVLTADGEIKMTRKQAFEFRMSEAYGYLKTMDFIELEEKIRHNTFEQMGFGAGPGDVKLGFDAHDPINVFKNLQLLVDQMGISAPAHLVGSGLQSAIVIAIFRTYAEIKKDGAIFAVEAPESFLNPQKVRHFSEVLGSISINNQVFITTHSPAFIKIFRPEEVCLVRRNALQGTTATICIKEQIAELVKKELELQNLLYPERNEMFFAQGIIFVAKAPEKLYISLAAGHCGINLDQQGISVIECGGKANLLWYTQVADAFHIPFVVVADEDILSVEAAYEPDQLAKTGVANGECRSINDDLREEIEDERLFWISTDIDGELGGQKKVDNRLENVMESFKTSKGGDTANLWVLPIRKIIALVNSSDSELDKLKIL
ncbi:MAG: AAA family ATPase [Firmicutes bacterium]|nr:AAA family ATPase [Bacillota bacterium]